MAIDITEGIRDKKEVASNVKCYIPRDLWSGLEKIMAVKLLQAKVETCVDKLLKGYKNTTGPFPLKEDFLRQTEKYFPSYFHEEFSAHWDEGGRISEIKLVITHPKEDKETQLVVLRRIDREEVAETVATISQICNIALQDAGNIEISRMNGIPLYFRILNQRDTISILSLLCGYYRLVEKWSFSLCSELKYPILEDLIANKVHGPITKEFAISKLQKLNFKKGSFLLRQSPDKHEKIFLLFCYETGCRPEELCILRDKDTGLYSLDRGGRFQLPEEVYQPFSSVSLVVQAIRTGQTCFQLLDCIHLSEYDKCPSLLLCRNPVQWKHDSLGSKPSTTSDRYFIPYNNLSKFEGICHQGRMCKVWKGEWRQNTADRRVVAIKQLKKDLMGEKMTEFLNLATRVMRWDDPSLVTVYGACLPMENEPLVIVREYFEYGPLDAYLRENKSKIQNVDMLEAGTSLARALYYLQGKGLVHGEIRCRNVYVMEHTDKLLKVKLCEGGLGAPRIEDVHWLDWIQLQGLLNSGALLNSGFKTTPGSIGSPGGGSCTVGGNNNRLKCSLASDIWSYGTLLWEIFSKGEPPLPNTPPVEACKQYISGVRLKWPLGSQLKQVEMIMMNCWSPLPEQRIKPQTIMRDLNQILYRVFNSRRANDYVTIDSGVTISTTAISSPGTPPTPPLTSTLPCSADRDQGTLVPVFTEHTRNLFESSINQLLNFTGFGETDSTSPLINDSESSSSLYNSDISALTYQTSLDYGGNYSITSIYPLEDDQIEYNTDFPLGEGNFGIVYKGVLTKSDGDWEQVAVKMIKDTDIMPQSAFDDMEREIGLMKRLSHENIVKIRGYISNIGTHTIIVMEYIREGSLDRYLQVNRRTLDYPRQLFVYAQNIVDGMEYLTQNKIIHRDLAARNILVSDHEYI
ncbi:tyrosine-protein kinase JAK2 isoform X3 [Eurytemora carolleeae]|uniref:tyrosine-protein kinase JAK2 isoform X3 n=1 Tax=Eurytemora carolleeae TaxID=1294199 RepID=UPI000C7591AE|nr:tyrosine-protein kinase JAK2 isoform X3 [Eurytemora carolleeae]|eukprot:XP_023327964.1 tyrosine-protein kinase JAK2-like isoform X3 [Eurytemora affinis]